MANLNNPFMKYYADYKSADTWGKVRPYLASKWHTNRRALGKKMQNVFDEIKSIIKFIDGFHQDMKIEYTPLSSIHWINVISSNDKKYMETIYIDEGKLLTPFGHFRFDFSKRFFPYSDKKLYTALKQHTGKNFEYEREEILGWSYIKYPISNPVYLCPSDTCIRKKLL